MQLLSLQYFLPYSNSRVGFLAIVRAITGCEEVFVSFLLGVVDDFEGKICDLSFVICG